MQTIDIILADVITFFLHRFSHNPKFWIAMIILSVISTLSFIVYLKCEHNKPALVVAVSIIILNIMLLVWDIVMYTIEISPIRMW